MSGICGICEPGATLDRSLLEQMLPALNVGGEVESARLECAGFAGAVMRHWDGQQAGELGGVRVVADSDIWNFRALASEMVNLGDAPPGCTVAELIAALYLRHGDDFVQHLNGAFSIALWDDRRQRLLLMLDRFGIKSLYWSRRGQRLLFGSRISAIASACEESPEPDPRAIAQFFIQTVVPAPLTIFRDISRLEPGTQITFERGNISERRYWDIHYQEKAGLTERQWAECVRDEIRNAVFRTANECDPNSTGAYLSGGTDSSSVVAFLTEWHAPAKSFSIVFDDPRYSEASFANTTAQRFATEHHELRLNPEDALAALEKVSQFYDEPFANSSAIGGYHCARVAREAGVTTMFAGDGGDEIFAGNERYAKDRMFQMFHQAPAPVRTLLKAGTRLLPLEGVLSLPRRYVRRASIPNPRRMMCGYVVLAGNPEEIFEADFLQAAPPESWLSIPEGHFRTAPDAASELNRLLYLDVKMTLGDNDLRKVIGTAELGGVQVRFPFLDHKLVEFAATIPSRLKMKGSEKRYIFKKAMHGTLPDFVLYKKKHGFGVPLGHWLLNDPKLSSLCQDVLADSQTVQRGWMKRSYLEQLRNLHRYGHAAYYGDLVWCLVVLELWQRNHFAGRKAVAGVR